MVKSVIAAAAQPPMSKAADAFGRFELVSFSAFFYVIGTIIEATSTNIQTYAGGQVNIMVFHCIRRYHTNTEIDFFHRSFGS